MGVAAAISGFALPPFCASDVSDLAAQVTRLNAENYGVKCDVRVGSLLDPWSGELFDTIIDDVSGIAEEVARISPWFGNRISCASGVDGTDLTRAVIRHASNYLHRTGVLLFPIISLSSEIRILAEARQSFELVEQVVESQWQLPAEMLPHMATLRRLRDHGFIDFQEIFGMVLCSTRVYCARLPKQKQ